MVKFTIQGATQDNELASTQRIEANTTRLGAVLQFSVCLTLLSFGWTKATSTSTSVPFDLGHGQDPNVRFQRVPEHPRSSLPGRAESFLHSSMIDVGRYPSVDRLKSWINMSD